MSFSRRFQKTIAVLFTIIFIVAFIAFIFRNVDEIASNNATAGKLYFSKDTFRILQVSDFHEWMGIEGKYITVQKELTPRLIAALDDMLENLKPDLVVLTGDNTFPLSFLFDFLGTVSLDTYKTIGKYFADKKQYFSLTFGNHDTESTVSKQKFISQFNDNDYFIGGLADTQFCKVFAEKRTAIGETDRMGNFSFPIYEKANSNNILANIFLLDSGSYYSPGYSYRSISEAQTAWYTSEVKRLKNEQGHIIPSLIFSHIPWKEMELEYEKDKTQGVGKWDEFYTSDVPSPIFEEIYKNGDVKGVFFGHEHHSDLTLPIEKNGKKVLFGITKCCQTSGYNDDSSDMFGRVIDLNKSGGIYTYMYKAFVSPDYKDIPIAID